MNNELVVAASQSEIQSALSSSIALLRTRNLGPSLLNGTNPELEFQIGADKGTLKLALPNITTDKLGISSSEDSSSLAEVDVRIHQVQHLRSAL